MRGVGAGGATKPLYIRGDGAAVYATVAQVMARLSTSGFTAMSLITDTGDTSQAGVSGTTAQGAVDAAAPSSTRP